MRERMLRFNEYMKHKGLNDNQVTTECGLSQGLLGQARTGKSDIGTGTVAKILKTYQDISRVWLLTGEGDMLQQPVSQKASGGHNTQIAGNGNNVNSASTLDKALDEIAEQRKLVSKSQEQIDRLLSIIEHIQKLEIQNRQTKGDDDA